MTVIMYALQKGVLEPSLNLFCTSERYIHGQQVLRQALISNAIFKYLGHFNPLHKSNVGFSKSLCTFVHVQR